MVLQSCRRRLEHTAGGFDSLWITAVRYDYTEYKGGRGPAKNKNEKIVSSTEEAVIQLIAKSQGGPDGNERNLFRHTLANNAW